MKKNKIIFNCLYLFIAFGFMLTCIVNNDTHNFYIMFDENEDLFQEIKWSLVKDEFPIDFNPKEVYVNMGELNKLNKRQREIYDSIKRRSYPKKNIIKNDSTTTYHIGISDLESVKLRVVNEKSISTRDISRYNTISVDSFMKIIPGIYRINNIKTDNYNYHVILKTLDHNYKLIKVKPSVVQYN